MRPQVAREATATRGVRKVTRTYADGRRVVKYEVRHKDATGTLQNAGTFDNYDEACNALIHTKAAVLTGRHVSRRSGKVRLGEVAADWLATPEVLSLKTSTRHGYHQLVNGRLSALHRAEVGRLGYREVSRFIGDLVEEGLSPATVGHTLFVLTKILDHAVRCGYIAANPCTSVKKPKARKHSPRVLEIEDVEDLIAVLDAPWSLLVEFAAYSGLRAGEIAGLRVGRLDLVRRTVTVA